MSLWLWLALGICGGAFPSLAARAPFRAWLARQCWWVSFWIAFCVFILPFGIVLVMLVSAWDFEAIREMGLLFVSAEFGWISALTLGWLGGSAAMALIHRRAPRLQGPPLSPEVMELVHGPARQPWGPLEWMYCGFTVAWYVALSIGFGLSIRSEVDRAHANYFVVGLAFFLFIPGLFAGFCGVCAGLVKSQAKADLRRALRDGRLTGRFAFLAGLIAGVVSIVGVLAVGAAAISISNSEAGIWLALAGVAGVLMASPYLGLWLMDEKSGTMTVMSSDAPGGPPSRLRWQFRVLRGGLTGPPNPRGFCTNAHF